MADAVVGQFLNAIELRERQLTEQCGDLAAHLRELQAEREELQVKAKTIRALAPELERASPSGPALPDGAAYQQTMGVFDHEQRPPCARDLCLTLDLPVLRKHTEGTRAKLKRLVSLRFLAETEPVLPTQPRPQAQAQATLTGQ